MKVAAMVGASETAYQTWETGRRVPRLYFQIRLAEVFGVERCELGFDG